MLLSNVKSYPCLLHMFDWLWYPYFLIRCNPSLVTSSLQGLKLNNINNNDDNNNNNNNFKKTPKEKWHYESTSLRYIWVPGSTDQWHWSWMFWGLNFSCNRIIFSWGSFVVMTMTSLAKINIVGTRNGAKMKKTGLRKSVKRKWRLFSVMIVHVGSGRLFFSSP